MPTSLCVASQPLESAVGIESLIRYQSLQSVMQTPALHSERLGNVFMEHLRCCTVEPQNTRLTYSLKDITVYGISGK